MKILVTGAAGYIGSHLCPALVHAGHEVRGVDHSDGDLLVPGVFKSFVSNLEFPYDMVVHLAAQPGRLFCNTRPAAAVRSNTEMTTIVAKDCGQLAVRLCYVSTSEVYGVDGFVTENSMTRPRNIYGLTKLWGEQAAQLFAPKDLLVLRPSMPYSGDMPVGHGRAALPTMISNAMHNLPIVVHRGTTRSWCYIDDLVLGMVTAIERGLGTFNIGRDDDERRMYEIAEIACALSLRQPSDLVTYSAPPTSVTPNKQLSVDRLRRLGWSPRVSLMQGMKLTHDTMLRKSRFPSGDEAKMGS